jgi:flagellar M-ring protein FliF
MDFLNKAITQVSELFRSMTPAARVTAGLLLGVIVVSLGYLLRQGTAGPDAFLFGGEALSDGELNRIEVALGEAGLTGVREGNRLRVPAAQQAAALAAIADADALPKNFHTILEDALGKAAPWESSVATRERLKIAKQRQLTEIIRAMRWVEDAVVVYDEQPPRGISGTKLVTGSVNVQPAAGESLTPSRSKALQKLVAYSVVGMKPENVAVTNLGEGGIYGGDDEMSFELFEDDYYRTKIAFETQLRERIWDQLRDMIPGVRVEVNAELDATKEEITHTRKPDSKTAPLRIMETEESTIQSTGGSGGQPGPIAQGPTRQGAAASPEQNKNETKSSTEETENVVGIEESRVLKGGYVPKEVHATVLIPSSYVESVWKTKNPTATDPPKPEDLVIVENQVKTTVENFVQPLLLLQATRGQNTYKYVYVQFLPSLPGPTIEPPSTTSQALAWAGRYWSTLAMLGVAMFSLLVMRSVVRGGPADAGSNASATGAGITLHTEDTPSRPEDGVDESPDDRPRLRLKKSKSVKDDLVEIVHEDPDAAAEILRSWIGKAS